jgi:hypothetical protein
MSLRSAICFHIDQEGYVSILKFVGESSVTIIEKESGYSQEEFFTLWKMRGSPPIRLAIPKMNMSTAGKITTEFH